MSNAMNWLRATSMMLALASAYLSSPTAEAACTLPVCDIPAEITRLASASQNERFQTVTRLQTTYKSSKDPATLANLREFAREAERLFVSISEEDWMVRAAATLYRDASIGLAKYERPVDSRALIAIYRELAHQESRFAILSYWTDEALVSSDQTLLRSLIAFGVEARKISQADGEEEYMLRQCDSLTQRASLRILRVNPFHEGIYSIAMTCRKDPRIKAPCLDLAMSVDRLTVLDTQASNGLVVTFSSSKLGDRVLEFATSSFKDAQYLRGISRTLERPGQFDAILDPKTGQIRGTLVTTLSLGINYDFVATPVRTAGMLVAGIPVRAPDEFEGLYEGTLGSSFAGQFIVTRFNDGEYRASFVDVDAPYQLDFQTSVTVDGRGLIALVAHFATDAMEAKLFLIQETPGVWTGFYVHPRGKLLEMKLVKRAARVRRPPLVAFDPGTAL